MRSGIDTCSRVHAGIVFSGRSAAATLAVIASICSAVRTSGWNGAFGHLDARRLAQRQLEAPRLLAVAAPVDGAGDEPGSRDVEVGACGSASTTAGVRPPSTSVVRRSRRCFTARSEVVRNQDARDDQHETR